MKNEPINTELSRQQLEIELKRIEKRHNRTSAMHRSLCWLLIAIAVMGVVSTLWFPILFVTDAPATGFEYRKAVLTMRTRALKHEDKVAYQQGDESFLYDVVAVPDDRIESDGHGNVSINGTKSVQAVLREPISVVDDGCVLLMKQGAEIICVPYEEITGKVLLQLWPLPWVSNP